MKIRINELKQGIKSKLGGRALSNIDNFNALVQECLFDMMQNVSLMSAIRETPFISPLASKPYLWKLPNDFSLNGLISIHKGFNSDLLSQQYSSELIQTGVYQNEFMRNIGLGLVSIEDLEGEQFLNTRNTITQKIVIDNCEDETNGTWIATGTAHELKLDDGFSIDGSKSLYFEVNTTTNLWGISKTDFRDVVNIDGMKKVIFGISLPIDIKEGITVKVGNDNLNYKSQLITKTYSGERIKKGFNYVVLDLETATVTGTPNTLVNYFALEFTDDITANTPNFRLDSIVAVKDFDWYIRYYSRSVVTDENGVRRPDNLISNDTDIILLNEAEYILFLRVFSIIAATDIRPASAGVELDVYSKKLAKLYETYNFNYPSNKIIMSSAY